MHMCSTPVFWLLVVSSFNYLKTYAWSVYKHAVVAAFCIYAQSGEDAAKRQGSHHHGKTWKMDKMNSMHRKIMEFDILKKNLEKSWNFQNLDRGKSWDFEKS